MVIPDTIDGHSVVAIGDEFTVNDEGAWGDWSDVTVPEGVTSLGRQTFYMMQGPFSYISLPSTLRTIGEECFAYSDVHFNVLQLPDGLETLGDRAFLWCEKLSKVIVPASVVNIGQDVFDGCPNLTIYGYAGSAIQAYASNHQIPFVVIDNDPTAAIGTTSDGYVYSIIQGVASIEGYTGNQSVITLPSQIGTIPVTSVGVCAFRNRSDITEVTIPEGVISIDDKAFFDASISKITLPKSLRCIGSEGIMGCLNLTSLDLPEGLEDLGDYALAQCETLANITLPSTLKRIGKGAFSYTAIQEITLPGGVTEIPNWAFGCCYNLTKITIPASVTQIDDDAFFDVYEHNVFNIYGYSGSAAETFAFNAGIAFIDLDKGQQTFTGSTSDGYIYGLLNGEAAIYDYTGSQPALTIPAQVNGYPVTSIAQKAFYNRSDITSVTVPNGVVTIAGSAFNGCWNMTQINLPTTLKSIGSNALANCEALTSLTLPEGLTSLGREAIAQCANLTNITIPSTLREVGEGAFSNTSCTNVTTLPQGITEISDNLFWFDDLRSFVVPDSVTTIGRDAFTGCANLQYVVIPAGVTSIHANAFVNDEYGYNANLTIYGYTGSAAERNAASYYLRFVPLDAPATSITLPASLTMLDQQALAGTAAQAVYVPATCTAIGSQAFQGCTGLTQVHFAGVTTAIAADAFDGCSSSMVIFAPAGSDAQAFAQANSLIWIEE